MGRQRRLFDGLESVTRNPGPVEWLIEGRSVKMFRTEAVRAGFEAAYDAGDCQTIVVVARKLPEKVLQEDEKRLMYDDVAMMRMGEG